MRKLLFNTLRILTAVSAATRHSAYLIYRVFDKQKRVKDKRK